ncbi:hypothetical protein BXZ70DRAFT_1003970 [Cristinia sonorae]|uniref:Arrestin C-terminal-like domain-containing protein n=1 Tax=Cristinia sonorae TaxID=1940300 RepID=A0A8K0XV12_9AGAR|nr:hypothetical protein BXZ70DRAFT_1003970 [Cristinia sonorae]
MSSQATLTLRPPPNIDFVQGYPGIPPGPPDRPQAAVKGAIEVRVGPQGVKAKWVKIELRKIETLPGGGLTNTFFDYVGQSPISLWQSGEEYSTLVSQDFPFQIRIPESIPPSIALEKGAGVKYELIAKLCIKGKKGFLKRDKQNHIVTSSPIVIDKHELHSTWPVYTQPEGRRLTQEGVTLTVERHHTCFGPGDRIFVNAMVRSDSLSTVILRAFEFSLRETTVFRAGPQNTGKKGAPQVKVINVGEQKVPVNATLYGGTQHKAELSVMVPSHHTTTTLNAARHIDITYVLIVKAIMGTGRPVVIDLPVVISNWPRAVSVEAVRRIGLAPNVQSQSQALQGQPALQIGTPAIGQQIRPGDGQPRPSLTVNAPTTMSNTLNDRPSTANTDSDNISAVRFNTAPGVMNGANSAFRSQADEFGFQGSRTNEVLQIGGAPASSSNGRPVPSETSSGSGALPRPGTGNASAANRLTVTNFDDEEEVVVPQVNTSSTRGHQRQPSLTTRPSASAGGAAQTPSSKPAWLTAEEEKKRLYERAVADVERVQGLASPPVGGYVDAGRVASAPDHVPNPGASPKWLTAEEEKMKLYNAAQAAAARYVDGGESPPNIQGGSSSGTSNAVSPQLSGAALYAQAMSTVNRNASAGNSAAAGGSTNGRRFPTAEEEKAEMRRYQEAKAAVERNQEVETYTPDQGTFGQPISYEALYGPSPAKAQTSPPANGSMNGYGSTQYAEQQQPLSPPAPISAFDALSEKERLRRAYAAQDAMAAASRPPTAATITPNTSPYPMTNPQQSPVYVPPVHPNYRPVSPPEAISPPMPTAGPGPTSALAEKEMLRRRYEAQDAAVAVPNTPPQPVYIPPVAQMANGMHTGGGGTPTPPPRTRGSAGGGSMRGLPNPRAQPLPPVASSQPLSAAEEKARLRAAYEAQDAQAQARTSPSPPPPNPYAMNMYNPPSPTPSSQSHSHGHGMLPMVPNGSHNRSGSLTTSGLPPPPPLAPRPPREYIEETRQEDARTSAAIQAIDYNPGIVGGPELTMKPFTPFTPGFDVVRDSARPPLPTKTSYN